MQQAKALEPQIMGQLGRQQEQQETEKSEKQG